MPCVNCSAESINPCSCTDGYNAFTVSTTNVTIADPMTIPVSNTGQYTGVWARVGQIVFIQGYGYYEVTAATNTSISVKFPASPFVAGATFSPNTVDYSNTGTIISGAKISPGGVKGPSGNNGTSAVIEETGYGSATPVNALGFTNLISSIVIPANSLNTNGDSLIITGRFYFKYKASSLDGAKIKILADAANLTDINSSGLDLGLTADWPYYSVTVVLTRTAAGTANAFVEAEQSNFGYNTASGYTDEFIFAATTFRKVSYKNLTLAIDWTTDTNIDFQGNVASVDNYIKLGFYSVLNFQQIV